MRFCRHVPGLPLRLFVEFFWCYDSWYPDHAMENCLPDGSFELIINLQEQPRKLFDREDISRHRAFRRAWLPGTHSGYIVIDALPASSMMGVHFKPGRGIGLHASAGGRTAAIRWWNWICFGAAPRGTGETVWSSRPTLRQNSG